MLELFISLLLPDHTNWLNIAEQSVGADVVYTHSSWVCVPITVTWSTYKASALCPLSCVLLIKRFLISDTRLLKHKGKKGIIKN